MYDLPSAVVAPLMRHSLARFRGFCKTRTPMCLTYHPHPHPRLRLRLRLLFRRMLE
jgi:hypothetical protein